MARRLDEILKTEPNTNIVRLEYEGLADLAPLLPVLGVLPNLEVLDLRGNKLEALPRDLSSLRRVHTVHLQQNLFRVASDVLTGLASMPALKTLNITLSTAEEEERLLVSLPKLEVMNGAVLTDDMDGVGDGGGADPAASSAAPPPQSRGPPPPPVPPASGSVRSGAGGGAGAGPGAPGGATPTHHSGASPAASSPAPSAPGRVREIAMTEDDLEAVALLYGAINALGGSPTQEQDNALTEEFERHIHDVMRGLGAKLEGVDDPFVRQGEILAAKHDLYDICFQKSIDLGAKSGQQFGNVLRKLRDVHAGLFREFPGVLQDMRPHYTQALEEMKDEVARAHQETGQLLEAAEALEQEAAAHSEEKERLGLSFQKERQRLLAANKRLQAEAAELQARLRQYEAGGAPRHAPLNGQSRGPPPGRSPAGGAGSDAGANSVAPVPPIGNVNVRNMSLKQLKEVIEAIYASKVKFDKKCADAHLPRETMEQHMYTYLNQKYGLRSLIVEHASSIHRAVKRYSAENNDVAVFGLILRNEIDEEFRYVQKQLKETVADLLRVYLKGKFPLKTDDAINDILSKRLSGHVYEEEWVDIIKYMYNHEDSLALIVMVNDLIQATPTPTPARRRRGDTPAGAPDGAATKGRVRFKAFLKVLLDFQLKGHQRFLSNFHAQFSEVDTDANGVIDEGEFRDLVRSMDPEKTDADLDTLVNLVDPYDNQHITFSECVSVLSAELVRMMSGGGGAQAASSA